MESRNRLPGIQCKGLQLDHSRRRRQATELDPGLDAQPLPHPRTAPGEDVGAKVRQLIDDHVASQASPRAQASEMEHTLRDHIRKHFREDPEHYEKLSERLEHILSELQGRWEGLVGVLRDFKAEVAAGREEDDTGLDPETQALFLGLLKQAVGDGRGELDDELLLRLVELIVDLTDHIRER